MYSQKKSRSNLILEVLKIMNEQLPWNYTQPKLNHRNCNLLLLKPHYKEDTTEVNYPGDFNDLNKLKK